MRTEESKRWRAEGMLPLELMVAFLGRRRGCNGKSRGTSDRPHASQVSFSLRDRGRLSFLKINATIFATHRIFCKLILALSHSLKSRRALDGFDKSTVVDMAPGQFGFLPLAHWLSGRSLWDLSYPAVRSPSHTERPSIGTPLGLTPPLSSQLMAGPSAI